MSVDVWVRSAGVLATGLTVAGLLGAGAPAVAKAPSSVAAATYLRASVQTGGGQPSTTITGTSYSLAFDDASVSDDGRFTVFSSNADDLVPGDTNRAFDVFLRDSVTDVTTRISAGEEGGESRRSGDPSMSADGRYIAFASDASNLVPGDTNSTGDVFLRDTVAGVTTRVSLTANGGQATWGSGKPAISPDGRYVVFESSGPLVAGVNHWGPDVYLRELATGRTVRISASSDGQPLSFPWHPFGYNKGHWDLAVTSGGSHVLFVSEAENLVPGDTNGKLDVFVRDVAAGTTARASVTDSEAQIAGSSGSTSMSADGRHVAFKSRAGNVDPGSDGTDQVYVRDVVRGTTTRVTVRDGGFPADTDAVGSVSISPEGRHVAFGVSSSSSGRYDIFLRDLDARTTRLVTVSPTGGALNGHSWAARFSPNGRHLVFRSEASDAVDGDTNDNEDVFVRLNVR